MDIKKWVKKKNKEYAEEILERNRPFHDMMIAKISEDNSSGPYRIKRRNRLAVFFVSAVIAFCAVFFPVYFCCVNRINKNPPLYFTDNFKERQVELSDWNDGGNEFLFTLDQNYVIEKSRLIYDSISNDSLYYHLLCVAEYSPIYFEVLLYPNPDYSDENRNVKADERTEVNGYELYYDVACEDLGGMYRYACVGKIESGDESVVIKYNETVTENKSNFIDFVKNTVNLKNKR